MDKQLSEIEKAFHDARQELIKTAQRSYESLKRELDKLTARNAKTAKRVNELARRLQEHAQRAIAEGSKAASAQANRIERTLVEARKELDAVTKDQQWLKSEAVRAYDYFRRVSGIDRRSPRSKMNGPAEPAARRSGKPRRPARRLPPARNRRRRRRLPENGRHRKRQRLRRRLRPKNGRPPGRSPPRRKSLRRRRPRLKSGRPRGRNLPRRKSLRRRRKRPAGRNLLRKRKQPDPRRIDQGAAAFGSRPVFAHLFRLRGAPQWPIPRAAVQAATHSASPTQQSHYSGAGGIARNSRNAPRACSRGSPGRRDAMANR
jgi:hypothetical protein